VIKIAVFFGGKVTRHLGLIKQAAKKLGVRLDLISYNRVYFETEKGEVRIRKSQITNHKSQTNLKFKIQNLKQEDNGVDLGEYDVVFFRTTGKHWEEVDLVNYQLSIINYQKKKKTVVVDPMVVSGKPSYACKAWQMLKLTEAGIAVPRTIYGSLWFLYETMKNSKFQIPNSKQIPNSNFQFPIIKGTGGDPPTFNLSLRRASRGTGEWRFPVIVKGSGGDRGTRVFKADNLEELEKLVRELRKSETKEGKRYMLQEYIENDGDYRVLVLGEKVLGVMKRSRQKEGEFRNNFSVGGKVEVADLPKEAKEIAIRAAKVCGLAVAGVDLMSMGADEYVVLEVNKGPQFCGFMKATGIDVPQEIVKFLVNLKQ